MCAHYLGFAEVNDEKFSICMFKESVHSQYKEQWADDIWANPKQHTLRMIKYG